MRPFPSQNLRSLLTLAIGLLATSSGCEWMSPTEEVVSEESQPRQVYALGRIEPAGGVIDVRATPGDRLTQLFNIIEGELAPEDGVLGLLSSYDMGKAQLTALLKKRDLADQKHDHQLQVAGAQIAQAYASKAQAEAKQRELDLQLNKLEALRVARDLAENEYLQLERLRSTDPELVTEHQLEKQRNQMDLASADYTILRDSHASASAAAELAVQAAEANVAVAEVTQQQATKNFEKQVVQQEIEVAREALKRSILLAPQVAPDALRKLLAEDDSQEAAVDQTPPEAQPHYTVLKSGLRIGEIVTQAPILQLGDLRKMVCVAEVYEADVKELKLNQVVTIRSPAFAGRFSDGDINPANQKRSGGIKGHAVSIGRMIAPPGLSNRNPLAPADRSVVEVRIEIDEEEAPADGETAIEHASRHVGLQVTVEFEREEGESSSNHNAQAGESKKPQATDP
ncbi:MAG: hypothetical protein KDA57_12530 [Planctomycetales bacterium]|nr:hypothetical protein [Planctomycetales bacterium]